MAYPPPSGNPPRRRALRDEDYGQGERCQERARPQGRRPAPAGNRSRAPPGGARGELRRSSRRRTFSSASHARIFASGASAAQDIPYATPDASPHATPDFASSQSGVARGDAEKGAKLRGGGGRKTRLADVHLHRLYRTYMDRNFIYTLTEVAECGDLMEHMINLNIIPYINARYYTASHPQCSPPMLHQTINMLLRRRASVSESRTATRPSLSIVTSSQRTASSSRAVG